MFIPNAVHLVDELVEEQTMLGCGDIGIHEKTSKGSRMSDNVETAQNHDLSLDTKGMIITAMLVWDYSTSLTYVILCIVYARSMIHTIHSRYIPSYELWYIPSYQESFHNKLTTDRGTHLCRHYKTNWASLPWGFEMIKKRLAQAHSICASIVSKATSIANMIESNH